MQLVYGPIALYMCENSKTLHMSGGALASSCGMPPALSCAP